MSYRFCHCGSSHGRFCPGRRPRKGQEPRPCGAHFRTRGCHRCGAKASKPLLCVDHQQQLIHCDACSFEQPTTGSLGPHWSQESAPGGYQHFCPACTARLCVARDLALSGFDLGSVTAAIDHANNIAQGWAFAEGDRQWQEFHQEAQAIEMEMGPGVLERVRSSFGYDLEEIRAATRMPEIEDRALVPARGRALDLLAADRGVCRTLGEHDDTFRRRIQNTGHNPRTRGDNEIAHEYERRALNSAACRICGLSPKHGIHSRALRG